jgi:hypothetical protein
MIRAASRPAAGRRLASGRRFASANGLHLMDAGLFAFLAAASHRRTAFI